jgi:hypothetical protein
MPALRTRWSLLGRPGICPWRDTRFELAGLPRLVIQRAGEILAQLEAEAANGQNATPTLAWQLRLFADESPLIEELRGLDIASLSQLEAPNKLFEWQERWARGGSWCQSC